MGVNPANGEVYVTCEEKGEVFAIDPDQQRVIAKIDTGGRPRSVAFLADGSRAYVACENGGYVAVIDARSHKLLSRIQLPTGSLPMGTAISNDGKELYVSTGRGNAVAIIDREKMKSRQQFQLKRLWESRSTPMDRSFTQQTAHQTMRRLLI